MPADGLIKSCIASEKNGLFHADLLRLAAYLKLDASKRQSRLDLLRAIAMKVSEGDEAFMQQVLKLEKSDSVGTLSCLIDDPLVEVAYDELAEQDKSEMKDIKELGACNLSDSGCCREARGGSVGKCYAEAHNIPLR